MTEATNSTNEARRVTRHAAAGVVTSVARKGLLLLYGVLFVRLIGPDRYGLVVAFLSVATPVAIIASFASNKLLLKEVAEAVGQDKSKRASAAVLSHGALVVMAAILLAAAVALLSGPISRAMGGLEGLELALVACAWVIVPMALEKVGSGALLGFGRSTRAFVLVNLVGPATRLLTLPVLALLVFAVADLGPWVLAPELAAPMVVVPLMLASLSGRIRSGVRNAASSPLAIGRVFWLGLPIVGHELSGVAFLYTDKLMIAGLLGERTLLSFYGVAMMLGALIMVFHQNVVAVISAPISAAAARRDRSRVRDLYRDGASASFALACSVYLALLFFGSEILSLYGAEFAAHSQLLALVGLGFLISTFAGAGGFLLIARNKGHYLLYNSIGLTVLNVGLNLWLIPAYGVLGAAAATATSFVAKNLLIMVQNLVLDRIHPITLGHFVRLVLVLAVAAVFGFGPGADMSIVERVGAFVLAQLVIVAPYLVRHKRAILELVRTRAGRGS